MPRRDIKVIHVLLCVKILRYIAFLASLKFLQTLRPSLIEVYWMDKIKPVKCYLMQHKILFVFHTGILKNWEGECSNIPDVTLGFFSKQPIKFSYHLGKNNLVKGIAREERGFLDAFHPFASSFSRKLIFL